MREALLSVSRSIQAYLDNKTRDTKRGRNEYELWARLKHLARTPCATEQNIPELCLADLRIELNERLRDANRQIPQRDALAREIAGTRARMVELACGGERTTSDSGASCVADLEGSWSWSWGHGDQEIGRQQTTISRGPAQFSRDARRGRPADGTMSQSGNAGVWKCDGSSVTFEWGASVDTLNVINGQHLQGQGKGDDTSDVNWVRVTR